jgi:hypothetical protein
VVALKEALAEDLERVAALASGFAGQGEELAGILVAEPWPGRRAYVCAYDRSGSRSWLALDADGRPLVRRTDVRDAVSIAALCELAVETAGGGDLEELRSQLLALRLRENPPGIEQAEQAALELERTIGGAPRVASPTYLDAVGNATVRLEYALGQTNGSPFAAAMKQAMGAVESLSAEVEGNYQGTLE